VSALDKIKGMSPQTKLFGSLAATVVFLDQVTKYYAVKHLTLACAPAAVAEVEPLSRLDCLWRFLSYAHPPRGRIVAVVDSFFHFRYVENPGAAWGFLQGSAEWFRTPFFLTVSVAAMAFILTYFRKTLPSQGLLRVALALVFGGALGNFVDRVRFGYVVDFIDWHWYDRFTWPTFNIADAGISIGVGLLVLDMLVTKSPQKADGPNKTQETRP